MESLNLVNLIQAGIIATGILGGLLLWLNKPAEYKGIAALLFTTALAASINILEETGLTREIYLISPVFIMLFGPLTYLSAKLLIDKKLASKQWLHLLPVIPFLLLTSHIQVVIALGTLWRLAYAALTAFMLLQYKRSLDDERSDSEDFSLTWLVWLLIITAAFNLVDLIRLNMQHMLSYDLNVLGQGINNAVWLIAVIVIIIKLQMRQRIPKARACLKDNLIDNSTNSSKVKPLNQQENQASFQASYQSLFNELDDLITSNQWFLKARLTLTDISDFTGMQTRDISRAINLSTQKSFNEYINTYRVEYVCQALKKNTKKSLLDISIDAGFSSKASFNKVFKQLKGITPSEYKAHQQG
ncbi:helix-turn-helix domain-containing protein [Thalassotalea sp. PLHSN55]|uniref:helix-turn-helix domain-containing protein n=1 Tax=Thalassotalea sp. PLHSN55 TaxID=3435888 RepID=UPI003F8802B3